MEEPVSAVSMQSSTPGLRSLAGRSAVYALGGLAYKGIALLSVPLLARLLQPAELGLLDAAAVLATVVGLVAGLGSEQAVAWLEPRLGDDPRLWSSALTLVLATALILVLVVALASETIAAFLTGDPRNAGTVVAAGAYGMAIALTAAALNAVRLRGTPIRYAIASLLVVTAEMLVALLIAWRVSSPVQLMVLGWAGAAALASAGILMLHLPSLVRPEFPVIRRLLRFGVPLVPAAIAWILGDAAVRSTIARDANLATLGEYGIAYRIASALAILVTGFAVAWQPYIYSSNAADVYPRARRTAPLLVLVLGWAAIVLTLFGHEVVAIVSGPGYEGAVEGIAPLAGGMVALGLFLLLAGLAGATSRTVRVGVIGVIGMVIQAVGAIVLVGTLGLAGAGAASLVGYAAAAVLLAFSTRFFSLNEPGLALVAVLALTAVGLSIASSLVSSALDLRLASAGVVSVLGLMILGFLRRLTPVART